MTEEATNLDVLADRIHGQVWTAATNGYDEERLGFQRLRPHHPAVIVGATDEQDVRAAVTYAAMHDAKVAVQASGHGLTSALEGGVLISTRRMSGVRVDPEARTARIEAGATWQQVIEATSPHGLAPLSGSSPGVGAVAYTLGGGVGLLARRYGFAADHVRRIDVVTADGELRRVTATEEPDLFWGLRGGGGNFGVVTGLEIDLVPAETIYGGGLYFDVAEVPDVLDAWRRWTETLPEELTSAVAMLPFPDLPMVPEPLRGRHVAHLQISYLGSVPEGERLVEPLRALGTPLRDTLGELPYLESGKVFDEPDRPDAYRSVNLLVQDLEDLTRLTKLAGPSAPVMCVVGLRQLGGALARPPQVANAVGHREAAYSLSVLSPVEPREEEVVRAVHRAAVEPWVDQAVGRSLNFSFGPLEEEQVRSAFAPRDYRRLTELKTRYDPNVLFHSNHAIPPALPV
jgi:FAD/FMN-containing dehydrogenase